MYEETSKEAASRKEGLHANRTQLDDPDRIWKATFLSVRWNVSGIESEKINLLNLELQIKCGNQRAWLCGFGEGPFPEVDIDFPSWEEGVQKYLEIGKDLLQKYAPEMEIPLPA